MWTVELQNLTNALESNGFEVRFVGGCVRDMILGIAVHDFDLATNAQPQVFIEILRKYKAICPFLGRHLSKENNI